jgi:hypothetical protein
MELDREKLAELIHAYNKKAGKTPQCYHTSHDIHQMVKKKRRANTYCVSKGISCPRAKADRVRPSPPQRSLPLDDLLKPGLTTVELRIIANDPPPRGDYIIPRFFIPRLFVHSFLVVTTETRVFIVQSWFGVMDATILYDMTHAQAKKWVDRLCVAVNNFSRRPWSLFRMFGYPKDRRNITDLLKYIPNAGPTTIELELHR